MSMTISTTVSAPVSSPARLTKMDLGGKRKVRTLCATIRVATITLAAGADTLALTAYVTLYRTDGRQDPLHLPANVVDAYRDGLIDVDIAITGPSLSESLASKAKADAMRATLNAHDRVDALQSAYRRMLAGAASGTDDTPAAPKRSSAINAMFTTEDEDAADTGEQPADTE